MKSLSLKQHDLLQTLENNYTYISKIAALKFLSTIFGSTATVKDMLIAYSVFEENS